MNRFKNLLNLNTASGLIGFGVTLSFGLWLLAQSKSQNLNVASWAMWSLLDGVVVMLGIRAEKERVKKDPSAKFTWPYLFIGWTSAAVLVTASMIWNGVQWKIGIAEIVCITAVAIATYFWWKNRWGMGFVACAVAMFMAGIPQIVDFWYAPAVATWWVWAGTAPACMLSIAASNKKISLQNAPTYSSLLFQAVILSVLFRGHLVLLVIQLTIVGLLVSIGALWLVARYAGRRT